MKKLINILFLFYTLLNISCQKANTDDKDVRIDKQGLREEITRVSQSNSASCGGFHSGNFYTINQYYAYPSQLINTDCAPAGATITVIVWAKDIPNRFKVVDQNNSYITGTGWLGTATYYGYWGPPFSTSGTAVLTFTKVAGKTYYLKVETQTPPNTSYYPNSDNWEAQVSCECYTPPPPPPPPPPACPCGGFYSGNFYTINQYYTYPLQFINDTCAANGATITVTVWAKDIPNRFTLLQEINGYYTTITSTGWLGTATYGGNWGLPFSNSGTATFTYTRNASAKYYLRVETQTPPDYSYTPNSDNWEAQITCP